MHTFTVWAPAASSVEVEIRSPEGVAAYLPMEQAGAGWWRADAHGAGHGTDYLFRLDGGDGRPDPRSPWQPDGVHGVSRVFDASRYAWSDSGWAGVDVRGAVLYELHVGTFTAEGTFDAAVARLDHLVSLGVDVVSVMPVAAFPGRWGWGYDGVDLYAVHDAYGGPEAFQRFVDAAHRLGLGVCLDVVYNHLGPSGAYLSEFGPYFSAKHETPWGQGVNLDDEGSEHVRRFIVDNALRWFRDFGVDALRLDAVHALVDDSAQHVLAQLAVETAALSAELGRPLGLVAESDLNDARMVTPVEDGGLGMTAQWSDDFHHALHALMSGERQGYYVDFGAPDVLAKTLTKVFLHDGSFSTFRGKDWGAPVDRSATTGHAFLAYTANHDQVGNRATGDRPSATLPPGLLAAEAALTLLSPFSPMLFMGEEWGASTPWQYFTDHAEPELAEAIRQGRRREFAEYGWDAEEIPDPQADSTRDASVLRWDELEQEPHARLLRWYRSMVALRRAEPDLRDGRLDRVDVASGGGSDGSSGDDGAAAPAGEAGPDGWFVLSRGGFRVVCALGADAVTVPLDVPAPVVVQAWDGAEVVDGGLRLPGRSVAVVAAG